MSTQTSPMAELFSCHPRISRNPGKPGAFTAARTGSVLSRRLQSRRCSAVAHFPMEPHRELARQCMEAQVRAREAKMRCIAFNLMICADGRPTMNPSDRVGISNSVGGAKLRRRARRPY